MIPKHPACFKWFIPPNRMVTFGMFAALDFIHRNEDVEVLIDPPEVIPFFKMSPSLG
jgi:hypothetical protein